MKSTDPAMLQHQRVDTGVVHHYGHTPERQMQTQPAGYAGNLCVTWCTCGVVIHNALVQPAPEGAQPGITLA